MKFLCFLNKILDYLYYRKCYICSKKCTNISICNECLENLYSNISFKTVNKFGINFYTGSTYEGDLIKIIRALKYHKKSEFQKILSDIIIKTIEYYNLDIKDFVICPVPIHINRFKKRKYNHMELVANEVAKYFNIPVESNLLVRIKDTVALYKLSIPERKKTIANAFIATDDIKGKKILLIDDIITSGSTVCELLKIMKEKKVRNCIVVSACCSANYNFF